MYMTRKFWRRKSVYRTNLTWLKPKKKQERNEFERLIITQWMTFDNYSSSVKFTCNRENVCSLLTRNFWTNRVAVLLWEESFVESKRTRVSKRYYSTFCLQNLVVPLLLTFEEITEYFHLYICSRHIWRNTFISPKVFENLLCDCFSR